MKDVKDKIAEERVQLARMQRRSLEIKLRRAEANLVLFEEVQFDWKVIQKLSSRRRARIARTLVDLLALYDGVSSDPYVIAKLKGGCIEDVIAQTEEALAAEIRDELADLTPDDRALLFGTSDDLRPPSRDAKEFQNEILASF